MNKTMYISQVIISFVCLALVGYMGTSVAFADHGDEDEVESHATTVHDDEADEEMDGHDTDEDHAHSDEALKLESIVALLQQVKMLVEQKNALSMGHSHEASDTHTHTEMVESHATAKLSVTKGMMGNYDLHLETTDFTFAPEHADDVHVAGEGHVHVMIDGVKAGRMYSPWMYVGALSKGTHTITASLATNDHKAYAHDGKAIESSVTVVVE